MQGELSFVPRIVLCGDKAEFLSRVGDRPFKIVGEIKFFGEVDGQPFHFLQDGKSFFNDKLQNFDALRNFLFGGAIDYLIFNSRQELSFFRSYTYAHGFLSTKVITLEEFKILPSEFFYEVQAEARLLDHLKFLQIKTLLDVDGYFAKGNIFTKLDNDLTEIDCISEKPLPPIMENIYTHAYKNLAEVGYKRYDAAIILERPPLDVETLFIMLENFTDTVAIFLRRDSELQKHLVATANNYAGINGFHTETGSWFFLRRHKRPENFCIYVVTYKDLKLDEPPEGYKIIQAGHALNKDTGYLGDDTGENISYLNLYLNELTALYWMWKNTTHSVIGLCHYRRFFTEGDETFSYDKILRKDAALKILERYDMIVSKFYYGLLTQREFVENDNGHELTVADEAILRKHLLQAQPDYLDAFEQVMNSTTIYRCHLFITRRNILDVYCRWLFSFIIDFTEELIRTVNLPNLPFTPRRLAAFFAERMLTVWLIKNRLRLKELNFMFIEGI